MRANAKNVVIKVGLRAVVGAAALVAGCASEDADTKELRAGTYAVTGLELGSCAEDSWIESGTSTESLVIEVTGDDVTISGCSAGTTGLSCTPTSPARYAWSDMLWRGEDGGAYLVESGCLLVHVDATARLEGGELVIETARWSEVSSNACTLDAVTAMRARPCDGKSRLYAVAQ